MAHRNQRQDFSTRDFIAVLLIIFNPPVAMVFAAVASLGNLITWADERSSKPKPPKPETPPYGWGDVFVMFILCVGMCLIFADVIWLMFYKGAH